MKRYSVDRRINIDHPKRATFDHIHPKSRGGGNEPTNLRLAHKRCNERRGSTLDPRT
jgi:5-methylcytosine-specific restriction endonuclease McrA